MFTPCCTHPTVVTVTCPDSPVAYLFSQQSLKFSDRQALSSSQLQDYQIHSDLQVPLHCGEGRPRLFGLFAGKIGRLLGAALSLDTNEQILTGNNLKPAGQVQRSCRMWEEDPAKYQDKITPASRFYLVSPISGFCGLHLISQKQEEKENPACKKALHCRPSGCSLGGRTICIT